MSVRVFAPAKINLTLQVGAVQADGYHPIESLVVFADIGDWIEAEPGAELSLDIGGEFGRALMADGDNLVLRAARALAEAAGIVPAARLSLRKDLPVASGIGGGSSDAAATLKALNALWGLNFGDDRLITIAAQLGADAPVCIAARSAWMSGVGERIAGWAAPPLPALLVNPLKPLATGVVFGEFDRSRKGSILAGAAPAPVRSLDDVVTCAQARGNDLAAPARSLMPEIAAIEALLTRIPNVRYASVSGSGATVFALFNTLAEAHALAAELAQSHPNWWARATTLAG